MPIVYASIMPHGDEIVPELVSDLDEDCKELYIASKLASEKLFQKDPDIIVIASPHNLRLFEHIGIVASEYMYGELRSDNGVISVRVKVDREYTKAIYTESVRRGIPVILVNYGASEGESSRMCLDWGTVIPLWFIKQKYIYEGKNLPKVVLVTPSREIDWSKLVEFGEVIASVSNKRGNRVAFIASADQAHTHDKNGPYGYDEASKIFDEFITKITKSNELHKILELDKRLVERAKPDSVWQLLIMYGAIKNTTLRNTINVYRCPSYFGMLVSVYE